MDFVSSILFTLAGLLIGAFLGFYFTKKKFEKELKENPPINEKTVSYTHLTLPTTPYV